MTTGPTTTRIRRCGEAALLLDCPDLAHAVALARELEGLRPEAVDVVPAARTVLVSARDAAALPALRRRVEEVVAAGVSASAEVAAERTVTIEVRYDGPDLADVADLAGVSVEALVRRHTSVTWRAAFGGFAPGFCYLVDSVELASGPGSPRRREDGSALPTVPRLGSPRTRVPAGSVGLADRFCAVYPGASPGGWRLLGTTDAELWDPDRAEPALLAPGDTVVFRDAGSGRGGGRR